MKKLFFLLLITSFIACKKDETATPITTTQTGSLVVKFDNRVGIEELILGTNYYKNAAGDSFKLTTMKYFVSNMVFTKDDGSKFVLPTDDSYFLVDEEDATTQSIKINNMPLGNYTAINFTIGVDSARCTADLSKRTGVLDPAKGAAGMYWAWNSGYIFMKLEGTSSSVLRVQGQPNGEFMFHIGGFGGYNAKTINNLKTINLPFDGDKLQIKATQTRPSSAHLFVDVLKIMSGPTTVSLKDNSVVMFNDFSTKIAANYANMFSYSHVENY
jgi:hypothetical protein